MDSAQIAYCKWCGATPGQPDACTLLDMGHATHNFKKISELPIRNSFSTISGQPALSRGAESCDAVEQFLGSERGTVEQDSTLVQLIAAPGQLKR